MKRKSLFSFLIGFICLFLVGCNPHHVDNQGYIYIGESYTIREYISEETFTIATIVFDDFTAEEINEDDVLIVETLTIIPERALQLTQNDFLLEAAYESHYNDDLRRKTDIEYNIKKNQYDIFSKEITDQTTYNFCFVIPIKNEYHRYDEKGYGIGLLVMHKIRLVVSINGTL